MSSSFAPRIAIVGGGPVGLTLMNVPARNSIAATLYERDASAAARAHLGGVLDLHEESEEAVLRDAGLFAPFRLARPEGQETIVTDRTGEINTHLKPICAARPEFDRRDLRQILIEEAPAGSIVWGRALAEERPVDGSHEWEVSFANGTSIRTVDLLVGTDGRRSCIRPLVSPVQPIYTGLRILELSFLASTQPKPAARCGAATVDDFDEGEMLGVQVNGDGRIRVYCFFPTAEDFRRPQIPESALPAVLAHFGGWSD